MDKIKIGITHGDINGIGYEVIIKSLFEPRINELFTPIVYGSSKVASYHRKTLEIPDFSFNLIRDVNNANPKRANIINCVEEEIKVDFGESTQIAGELSRLSIERAVRDLKAGKINALVTAPINKKNIQSDKFYFNGQTEYLAKEFGCDDYLMIMVSNRLKIGIVTGHIPLKNVADHITEDLILKKITTFRNSLIKDFGIRKPRIAVLGLNPHSGDNGLLGEEEEKIISPSIRKAFDKNMLVFGPYPTDGFFGSMMFNKFDGVLAMYHDQGLTPFKTISFDEGVNFTAGLPVIRTSPVHGTAYDIAGKNQASHTSFLHALFLACDIFNNRTEFQKLNSNPLKTTSNNENKS